MDYTDFMGFAAAGLVLATFCMTSMRALRTIALLSNCAFICYGVAGGLAPVVALHALLLPLNGYCLLQAARSQEGGLVERAQFPAVDPLERHGADMFHSPDPDHQMPCHLGCVEVRRHARQLEFAVQRLVGHA